MLPYLVLSEYSIPSPCCYIHCQYRRFTIIIIIIVITLFPLPGVTFAQFMRNSAKECAICHFRWLDQFYVEGRGTDLVEYQKERVAGSEMICYSCHNGIMVDSRERFWAKRGHRVNMIPSKKIYIPPDMPLGAKGELVCATCHTVHGVADELRFQETIFLRHSNRNSDMCMMCHITKTGGREQGNHPVYVATLSVPKIIFDNYGRVGVKGEVICETCHTVHGTIDKNLLVLPDRIDENIFTSDICQACHGSNPSRPEKGAGMGTHPVNIKPKDAHPPSVWKGERKVAIGNEGIIICETCHWPHEAAPGTCILAKKGEPSICMDCHKKQVIVQATDHDLSLTDPNAINIYNKTVKDSGLCSPCHIPHNAGQIKLWARKTETPYLNGISFLCTSCHRKGAPAELKKTGEFSHPVEIGLDKVPEAKTELPLYNQKGEKITGGKVTCSTCHNVHQWYPEKAKQQGPGIKTDGDNSNSFLRAANVPGSSLCLTCHQDKRIVAKTDHDLNITAPQEVNYLGQPLQKGGICSPCHVVHNGRTIKIWARDVERGDKTITDACISCHKEKRCGEKKLVGAFTHPVEKKMIELEDSYRAVFPQYDSSGRKTEQKGLITCASCHDPHQWIPGKKIAGPDKNLEGDGRNSFLRMANNQDSSMCVSCHRQKEFVIKTEHDLRVTAPKEKNILDKRIKESGVCGACHIPHLANGPRLFSKVIKAEYNPSDMLCVSCHSKEGCANEKLVTLRTHPMPQQPKISNKDLPLYDNLYLKDMEKGQLICITCHEPHQWDPAYKDKGDGKKAEGTGHNSFLRMASAPEPILCKTCHKDQGYVIKTNHDIALLDPNYNKGTCAPCHKVHNGDEFRLWASQLDPISPGKGPIDLLCQSCHLKGRIGEKKILTDGFSHPVNISLSEKKIKTTLPLYSKPKLTPIYQHLDKEKGDILTCQTCHDVHIWSENKIVSQQVSIIEGTVANSFLRQVNKGPGYICMDCHEDKRYIEWSEHDMRLVAPDSKNLLDQNITSGGICSPCHAVHHSPQPQILWARYLEGEYDFMLGTCVNCHKKGSVAGAKDVFIGIHPSSFVYTGKMLERLQFKEKILDVYYPLYDKLGNKNPVGFVTCTTCHDPHKWDPLKGNYPEQKNIEGDPTNSFLRNKGPAFSICLDCHGFEALLKYKGYHQPSEWKQKYWRNLSKIY